MKNAISEKAPKITTPNRDEKLPKRRNTTCVAQYKFEVLDD